jgi:hypothetical protein
LVNSLSLIYITPIFVFSFFPPTPNPTPDVMNWGIAMVGGVVILATVYYIIWGRHTYTPPNETIEDYLERNSGHDDSKKETSAERVEGMTVEVEKIDM